MPTRMDRKCNKPDCFEFGNWAGGYCPAHVRSKVSDRQNRDRHGLETCDPRWLKFISRLKAQGNVLCQSVDEYGMRCTRPTWGFHHILEINVRPDLGLHQENVVGICQPCHNKVEAKPERARYVPTLWKDPGSEGPTPETLVAAGDKVPHEKLGMLWTLMNRRARFPVL